MVLVIDNYDSFTYNLVQYFGELGADIRVRRNDQVTLDEIGDMTPDHIVISPGPGRPEAAGVSPEVIRRFGPSTPVLGVCSAPGASAWCRRTVVRATAPCTADVDRDHDVRHFAVVSSRLPSRSLHALVVADAASPSGGGGSDEDGTSWPCGTRPIPPRHAFHPESVLTEEGRRLLRTSGPVMAAIDITGAPAVLRRFWSRKSSDART